MFASLYRWHKRLSGYGVRLAAIGLAISIVSYSVEALARYLFNAPLNWSVDLGSYLLCVCVFLALPQITLQRQHIALGLVLDNMAPRHRSVYSRVIAGISAIVCLLTALIVSIEGLRQFDQHILTSAANPIPKWWLSAFVCLGLIGAVIHLVRQVIRADTPSDGRSAP
jgi:TRAP-type C4-dicarboxylate transport system permease small subunit